MPLLEDMLAASGVTPPGAPAPVVQPPPGNPDMMAAMPPMDIGGLLQAAGGPPGPPVQGKPSIRATAKSFVGDFLFGLGEAMKASASAPGRRGTMAGMGAALQAPLVKAAMEQEQQQKAAMQQQQIAASQANVRQSDAATELTGLQAQIALMKEEREAKAVEPPKPRATTVINGKLVDDADGALIADYSVPEKPKEPSKPTEAEYLRDLAFQVYAGKKQKSVADLTPEEQQSALADQKKMLSPADEDLNRQLGQIRLDMLERSKNANAEMSPRQQSAALQLADDFVRDSKHFVTIRDNYDTIRTASKSPTDPAANLALIFGYMKMLDPTSTVRETEFSNAENAAGVPERVRNLYNKMLQGTRIGPDQVKSFTAQAEAQYKTALGRQKRTETTYRGKAKAFGVSGDLVVSDLSSIEEPQPSGKAGKAPAGVGQAVWDVMTPQERALWK